MDYFKRLIKSSVQSLVEYKPGPNSGDENSVRISHNENGFGPAPGVREAAIRAMASPGVISRYPDAGCKALREALSAKHGLPADRFLVGNGLDDVLGILALAILEPEREVVVPELTFSVYSGIAGAMGARVVSVPMRGDLSIDTDAIAAAVTRDTAMIFLCNPNNPTGSATWRGEFDTLLERLESLPVPPLLVVDEAYADFVDDSDYPEAADYIESRRHIVVLRTFSKLSGLAGLRVGYAIADPDLLSYLYRVRQPFTVNGAAQAAALASLEPESLDFSRDCRRQILEGRTALQSFMRDHGIACVPSQANFVFAYYDRSSEELAAIESKLSSRGILIRRISPGGAPGGLRFSIGTPAENDRLIAALADITDGR